MVRFIDIRITVADACIDQLARFMGQMTFIGNRNDAISATERLCEPTPELLFLDNVGEVNEQTAINPTKMALY